MLKANEIKKSSKRRSNSLNTLGLLDRKTLADKRDIHEFHPFDLCDENNNTKIFKSHAELQNANSTQIEPSFSNKLVNKRWTKIKNWTKKLRPTSSFNPTKGLNDEPNIPQSRSLPLEFPKFENQLQNTQSLGQIRSEPEYLRIIMKKEVEIEE